MTHNALVCSTAQCVLDVWSVFIQGYKCILRKGFRKFIPKRGLVEDSSLNRSSTLLNCNIFVWSNVKLNRNLRRYAVLAIQLVQS